jgi:hypothetical protein
MTGYLKRLMGLVLVLTVSTWAQAICPMMLLPQAHGCEQHQANPAVASSQSSAHDCCPGKRVRMQHEQCERTTLSKAPTTTSCCSVEREPASTPTVQVGIGIAVIGRVMPSSMQTPSRAATLELSDAGPPLRGVLNLKEDLRI